MMPPQLFEGFPEGLVGFLGLGVAGVNVVAGAGGIPDPLFEGLVLLGLEGDESTGKHQVGGN